MFVAYDICYHILFVAYEICRPIMFVTDDVCRFMPFCHIVSFLSVSLMMVVAMSHSLTLWTHDFRTLLKNIV